MFASCLLLECGSSTVTLPTGTKTATRVLSMLFPYTKICSTRGFFLYTSSTFSTAMYSPAARTKQSVKGCLESLESLQEGSQVINFLCKQVR